MTWNGSRLVMKLVNRDFNLPADGWIQICPRGEFFHSDAKITQVFDAAAMEAMKNRFDEDAKNPHAIGTLLDFDHFSLDASTASEAAGWITAMEVRPEGLFAQVRWSDVGEAAVKGGRYRSVSPVFAREDLEEISDGKFRPIRLDSCALTNSPRLQMQAISNRNPGDKNKNTTMDHKATLLSLLGLPETATDEEIQAAIAAANAKRTEAAAANAATTAAATTAKAEAANRRAEVSVLQNRLAAVELERDGLLAEQIDRDLDAFSDVIENRDEMKKLLVSNRDQTLALLKQIKKPAASTNAGKAPLHNRETAKTPAPVTQSDGKTPAEKEETEKAAWIASRARIICRESGGKLPFGRAWPVAEAEWRTRKIA